MRPLEVILFLLGFGSILFLTYITTRYIAGKSNKAMKGKHINIVETVSLGMDKRLHLVKAGEQHLLIASTAKNIEFLSMVTIEDGEARIENVSPLQNVFDFKTLFDKYVNSYKNKKNNVHQSNNDISINQAEGEKFKTNLEKLKSITQKTVQKDGDDATDEE